MDKVLVKEAQGSFSVPLTTSSSRWVSALTGRIAVMPCDLGEVTLWGSQAITQYLVLFLTTDHPISRPRIMRSLSHCISQMLQGLAWEDLGLGFYCSLNVWFPTFFFKGHSRKLVRFQSTLPWRFLNCCRHVICRSWPHEGIVS